MIRLNRVRHKTACCSDDIRGNNHKFIPPTNFYNSPDGCAAQLSKCSNPISPSCHFVFRDDCSSLYDNTETIVGVVVGIVVVVVIVIAVGAVLFLRNRLAGEDESKPEGNDVEMAGTKTS